MRVLVVGGGIGGMALANALERAGLDPWVYERASALTEVGAGLGLTANAMKAMGYLGAADWIRNRGVPVDGGEWRSIDDGTRIYRNHEAGMLERYGEQYVCMHRADLLESLVRLVPSERVRLDSTFVGMEETPDGVTAHFADGHEAHGDVLVGADGLRSTVRAQLFGEQEARFTEVVAWRGLIPDADMVEGFGDEIVVWLGPERHAMTYPVRDDLWAVNAFVPAAEIYQEEWGPSDDLDHLRRSFAGVHPDVLGLIDGISEVLVTPIYFRDPVPVWGTDRTVLLGDAAHPAPSSAGQGAAMALEDALLLAQNLRRAGGPAGVPAALRDYARRRFPRTSPMLVTARSNLAMYHESDPVQIRARDGRFVGMKRLDPLGETWFGWLYDFDPVADAALAEPPAPRVPPRMQRDVAQQAHDLWREALTFEDRANLWRGERAGYARSIASFSPAPEGLPVHDDGDGLRVVPEGAREDVVVLHLHGGLYCLGAAEGNAELAGRLARAVGGWAYVPRLRPAPEHACPAALEDALAAYRRLRAEHPDARIVVSGESSGGALAVGLAVAARDAGDPLPEALHAVSPFCDLTLEAASILEPAGPEPFCDRGRLRVSAASYLHARDPADPLASPVLADLQGLPPLLIQAAAGEALADDARALHRAAEEAGVDVTLELVEDTVHAFVLFAFLPEAATALERLADHAAAVGATPGR
jgi:salicylate hydroxylase